MSMTISRIVAGVKGLNICEMTPVSWWFWLYYAKNVPPLSGILSLPLLKGFFLNFDGFTATLNRKRQYLVIILIITIVIIERLFI